MNNNQMMTLEEVADYLAISKAILYRGVRDNTLGIPFIKLNKAARFRKSDIDTWIDIQRRNTGPSIVTAVEEANARAV